MDSGSIIESGMPKKVISGTGPACPKCEQRFGAVYNDVETGTVLRQCGACGNRFPDPAEEAPAPLSAEDTALGLTQVLHSNIVAIGYNKATAVMLVRYHDGKLYRFEAVTPAAYQSILTAASPGAALYQMYGKKGKLTTAAVETPKTPMVGIVTAAPPLAPGQSTLAGNDHGLFAGEVIPVRDTRQPVPGDPYKRDEQGNIITGSGPQTEIFDVGVVTYPPLLVHEPNVIISAKPVIPPLAASTTPAPTTTLPPATTTPAPTAVAPTELPPAPSSK